eukprot:scaffold32008_cov107-Isochrysis_galbana.AAC.2
MGRAFSALCPRHILLLSKSKNTTYPSSSNDHSCISAVINLKKITDIRVARALHPHQSLPDPDPSSPPPLLSSHSPLTNPSPYQPFREDVLGRGASDITNVLALARSS